MFVLLGLSLSSGALAATIAVNTTSDSRVHGDGICTFREALENANQDGDYTAGDCASGSGHDEIVFNIPTSDPGCLSYLDDGIAGTVDPEAAEVGCMAQEADPDIAWWRLSLSSLWLAWHELTDAQGTTIDGRTQAAFAGGDPNPFGPELEMRRVGGVPATFLGISHGSNGNVIRDLAISGWSYDVIYVRGNYNEFYGNYIGTDVTGTQHAGNGGRPFKIDGDHGGGDFNVIGGSAPEERNILSGNGGCAVSIVSTEYEEGDHRPARNILRNNYMGLDRTGTKLIQNDLDAIHLGHAEGTIIEDNVMVGNDIQNELGIAIWDSNYTQVRGNYMGTDATGTAVVQGWTNGGSCVSIQGDSVGNVIGGTTPAERNVMANCTNGVQITSPQGGISIDNVIQGNHIGVDVNGENWADFGNFETGVQIRGEGSLIRSNIIAGTMAGPGVKIEDSSDGSTILGNVIHGNKGERVFSFHSANAIDVVNNTIVGNFSGGLLESFYGDGIEFRNNIVAFNPFGIEENPDVQFFYNDSFGNGRPQYQGAGFDETNISENPFFRDIENLAGPDGEFWTSDDGLILGSHSLCVDAGDPAMQDPDGTTVNMGAYGGTELAAVASACADPRGYMDAPIDQDVKFCAAEGGYELDLWHIEAAFKVGAPGITIECQDGTVFYGDGGTHGIGIFNSGHDNVTIRGCEFRDLNFGIISREADSVLLDHVTLTGNRRGVQFAQGHGNEIRNSEIRDNKFVDIAVYHGDLTIDHKTDSYGPDTFELLGGQIDVIGPFPIAIPGPEPLGALPQAKEEGDEALPVASSE